MTSVDTNRLLTAARVWHQAGCSVVPASADGSKAPFGAWKQFMTTQPTDTDLETWLSSGLYDGIGIICGQISGNLEMFEIEGRAADLYDQLGMRLIEHGYADLWNRLCNGYLERTPSGGYHWLLRTTTPPRRNLKLARRPATDTELLTNPHEKIKVLIETRGEGGFTIVAPSGGRTHPDGTSWEWISGKPDSIPTLTEDERDALHAIAATFDQMPETDQPAPRAAGTPHLGEMRPGDDYNQRTSWADILEPAGWTRVGALGDTHTWRRPGKTTGISATTGRNQADNLYVFSSSAHPFDTEKPYSKFAAHTLLNHAGDYSAAAKALAAAGYGNQRTAAASASNSTASAAPDSQQPPKPKRSIKLTKASDITIRPVHWTWHQRLPKASFALIAGREGIGKSTLAYQLLADITQGTLPGIHHNDPKNVIVAATEDSWEHTIVPRLMAAGANLERVLRVDVITHDDIEMSLTLPLDVTGLSQAITDHDVAVVLLDPLMSRLAADLDSHKDADTRRALEPLTKIADTTGCVMLGLIHVNKSTGTDPLTLIMGSRAFAAVARAVIFVMKDPDDPAIRLMGQEKNNLGSSDLPVLTFRIDTAHVADTPEGPVTTGRINWLGETDKTIKDAIDASNDDTDARSATQEAADWLSDYLHSPGNGGEASSADIKRDGLKAGHSQDALKRARRRLKLEISSRGYPRQTIWALPANPLSQA